MSQVSPVENQGCREVGIYYWTREVSVLDQGSNKSRSVEGILEEGYRRMAADTEHEIAAEEWCEALISDIAESLAFE